MIVKERLSMKEHKKRPNTIQSLLIEVAKEDKDIAVKSLDL